VAANSSGGASRAPIQLTVSPAAGMSDVSPAEPVIVTASGGKLHTVAVTAGGQVIDGTIDSNGLVWRSTGTLRYGQTYTVTASVLDGNGTAVDNRPGLALGGFKDSGIGSEDGLDSDKVCTRQQSLIINSAGESSDWFATAEDLRYS
jgi:hypothetical protein